MGRGRGIQKGHLELAASTHAGSRERTSCRFQVPHQPLPRSLLLFFSLGWDSPGGGLLCWVLRESGIRGSVSRPLLYLIGTAKRPFSEQLVGAEIPTDSNASIKSGGGKKMKCYKGRENPCLESLCPLPRPAHRRETDGTRGVSCKRDRARGKDKG